MTALECERSKLSRKSKHFITLSNFPHYSMGVNDVCFLLWLSKRWSSIIRERLFVYLGEL